MKKPLLWVLILVMSVSLIIVFSSGGCRRAAPPVEESVIEEPVVEEVTGEPEEERSVALAEALEAKATELTAKDPKGAEKGDIRSALELATEAQKLGMDQTAQDLLDWAREALTSMAAGLLGKVTCEATLDDVRQAIELAAEAQKMPGMEATADQLMDWARTAFQSYAARRVAAGADAQERTELAVEAQKIPGPGMDQLAEDLMEGKAITPVCAYSVHAELRGIHPETEITYHFIVDAYTCNEDIHIGWKGEMWFEATGYGQTESVEEALNFDLPRDGSYVVILPPDELGASIVGENAIIFTAVFYADEYYERVDFPPAEIKQGALANKD